MGVSANSHAQDAAGAPPASPRGPVHALLAEDVARALESDPVRGLEQAEAARRLESVGRNRLPRNARPRYLALAARQFLNPFVALLAVAAAVSIAVGEEVEAAAIATILVLNVTLGFVQEAAAERAILELREGLAQSAAVVRAGREEAIDAEEVVPGDVVVLRDGDRVPADARLVRTIRLEVDESALTGESLPAPKGIASVHPEAPLADRASMVYAGTAVTSGRGAAVVTATGAETERALISALAAHSPPPPTPLQRRLGRLARAMVAAGVAITLALATVLLLQGEPLRTAFLAGVAVAVAVVPEGLPATITIALGLGARAMARAGAVVRDLSAMETIGEATVICTDKTGTLTENRLRLASLLPAAGATERELLTAAVLASSGELVEGPTGLRAAGDPVEGALLLAAWERGVTREQLLELREHAHEVPFDPELRRMTVVYREPSGLRAFVKGAPEVLLGEAALPAPERKRLETAAALWAGEGLRVLAVADRTLEGPAAAGVVTGGLRLLGLVALHDPLRVSAPGAIAAAREAGVGVLLLTGDHEETGRAVGRAIGLPEGAVFARVTPAEKLRLVERLQAAGEVVAVTGDGVNDAPALRRADVGVAMGLSGTETAREAADIVLTDDEFATVVAALREGRRIADNVRKFVAFLLSANLGEVVLFAGAILAGLGAPMTVAQVLLVNVVTDGLPAVALARDPALPETMASGPRRGPSLLGRPVTGALVVIGLLVGASALAAYLVGRSRDDGSAQTMAFATVAFAELALVFTCRSIAAPAWRVPGNPHLVGGVLLSAGLVGAALYVPALHEPLGTMALPAGALLLVALLALLPVAVVESGKAVLARLRSPR